jgi:hypothetical protein
MTVGWVLLTSLRVSLAVQFGVDVVNDELLLFGSILKVTLLG